MSDIFEIPGMRRVDPRELQAFELQRQEDLKDIGKRGLRPAPHAIHQDVGWYCGGCGKWHAPHVHTCPEPPRDGSLRDRTGKASNG